MAIYHYLKKQKKPVVGKTSRNKRFGKKSVGAERWQSLKQGEERERLTTEFGIQPYKVTLDLTPVIVQLMVERQET